MPGFAPVIWVYVTACGWDRTIQGLAFGARLYSIMRVLKAGVLYFALVFGAGFVLGTIRTLWVVPLIGTRAAELAEAPIMLGIAVIAARFAVRRLAVPPVPSARLTLGLLALVLMLAAEFTLVLWLRGLSIREYLATRDPVSGTAYYVALIFYSVIPALVVRG